METSTPFQFSELLHSLREAELYKLPRGKTFLSAGCSGAWYFDWIQKTCRPVKHIGIELYSPRPDLLPENSEWIASSISAFPQVADESIDIVFSGQNIEHLWTDDVVGFFLESRRVLRQDGVLVVDTPNREITGPMVWTHPEHTGEFTVEELREMFTLAGFEVTSVVGHWLCREADSGTALPLVPTDDRPRELVVAERVSLAMALPKDAFSIWVTGVVAGAPDETKLRKYVSEIWQASNQERMKRSTVSPQCIVAGDTVSVAAQSSGFLVWGPYFPLLAGHYQAIWQLRLEQPSSGKLATIDVVNNAGTNLKAEKVIEAEELKLNEWVDVPIDFILPDTAFGLEFRLAGAGGHVFSLRRYADINRIQ
jgi:SAM-dependent methyltransferase